VALGGGLLGMLEVPSVGIMIRASRNNIIILAFDVLKMHDLFRKMSSSFTAHLLIALLLIFFITAKKMFLYEGNLSALIGIWEGFFSLNPQFFPKGFVVHSDGGYDGQFFYLISRFLFDSNLSSPPILDSFELRFSRIGLPFLSGIFGIFTDFSYYPLYTFFYLWAFHFLATYFIYQNFKNTEHYYLFLLFLYSPFAWNSNFLLISDSLFASFFVFFVFGFKWIGLDFFSNNAFVPRSKEYFFPVILLTIFFLSIRETSLPIVGSFLIFAIIFKHRPAINILAISIGLYILFRFHIKYKMNYLLGTNPMGFFDLIDYPFFGFFRSFTGIESIDFKLIVREIGKISMFILFLIQILTFRNIKNHKEIVLYLPLLFFTLLLIFAEQGYWLSYDNVSRFFTVCLPFVIFLKGYQSDFKEHGYFGIIFFSFILFLGRMLFLSKPQIYRII
jgi:hypothetical protein